MNKNYNLKLDLQFRCNNSTMKFNQFDNNTSDFFMKISNGGKSFDIEKAIVVLAVIKPSGKVASQFVEVENGTVYADLKPNMKDEIGTYTAQAMLILEDERVVTDTINYEVNESKILSAFIEDAGNQEEYNLLTDMLSKLSTIEISEEQRVVNEAERILSEENRKIEEAERVEAELIRTHEEADRAKYDAIRESNENIRKQNESIRLSNEANRVDEEAKRVDEENKRKLAEEERNANYNFMVEDEERRRSEADKHKEAEVLRVQAETIRVNEEAKRRTTEQGRVSAENTRVSNENAREANEVARQNNETQRVETETQRKNRYNSFITNAEANANNFENYTNIAKVKEEERKSNELDRKSQEDRRVSNEVERISNENTRKANEESREENETSRQNVFENKVSEVDEKISELNTTKDNFISSINTKVDSKISEIDKSKSDMTATVSNKIDEVENRFNALASKQQQDAEVIDARDGETSLKARLDRDIEKAKQVYVNVEGSHISTDSSVGYAKDVEILGNTIQDASNLADIRSVGEKVEGQELYEIPVLSVGKNLFDKDNFTESPTSTKQIKVLPNTTYYVYTANPMSNGAFAWLHEYDKNGNKITNGTTIWSSGIFTTKSETVKVHFNSSVAFTDTFVLSTEPIDKYEPYVEDKLTILSPTPLEKVGDVADRIIEKDGVWGVEKNIGTIKFSEWNDIEKGNSSIDGLATYHIRNIKGLVTGSLTDIINTKLPVSTSQGNERIYKLSNANEVVCHVNSDIDTIDKFKGYMKGNLFKYVINSQFIPLPHDQQLKLRTFANKTNISFLTEIEGTIKAQVPKSLGATVNTHTEQISNLNKELDRVKKLEESTVSTVETESDFTTVEATSNGYFEDVKLEGKTLVNLVTPNYIEKSGSLSQINDTSFKLVQEGTSEEVNYKTLMKLNPQKEYTIVYKVIENTLIGKHLVLKGGALANVVAENTFIDNSVGVHALKFTPNTSGEGMFVRFAITSSESDNLYVSIDKKILILEGDHTQNPPSYFEGLKSVGDGTDEIVVSSVNENLFDINSDVRYKTKVYEKNKCILSYEEHTTKMEVVSDKLLVNFAQWRGLYFGVWLKPNTSYEISFDKSGDIYSNLIDGRNTKIVTTDSKGKAYWLFEPSSSGYMILSNIMVKETSVATNNHIPHQSDKKRLLFYNDETQTLEKPILRQWDSIEKHSDGKYYYHQRSGEVVLNGSENWSIFSQVEENTMSFSLRLQNQKNGIGICDKFASVGFTTHNLDYEGVAINAHATHSLQIRILRSKLSTQDAEGFKQWLQANPVTVVYQLAEEKVYECTNIDLITYSNETNYIVESGAIVPKTTLKVHNNISNVVSLLQKKVSLLESNITSYMITQNRMQLASTYSADSVTFKVDYALCSEETEEYNEDLYNLILHNILVGKDNYDYDKMFTMILDYASWNQISWEQFDILVGLMDMQHNPPIEETPTDDEIVEEIPNEIM